MQEYKALRGIRMSDDLYEKVQEIAKNHHRSFNKEVVMVLEEYVLLTEKADNNYNGNSSNGETAVAK